MKSAETRSSAFKGYKKGLGVWFAVRKSSILQQPTDMQKLWAVCGKYEIRIEPYPRVVDNN